MSEGLDDEIVNYQTVNFNLTTINKIMVNSLKQLYFGKIKKKQFKYFKEFTLKMSDYRTLINQFEKDDSFSKHPLIIICVLLYTYIQNLSRKKIKFSLYIQSRDDALSGLSRYKKSPSEATLDEEDLVNIFYFYFKLNK